MLFACIALIIALIAQSFSRSHTHDLERDVFSFISRVCLVISLVVAPWSLKVLIAVTVLLIPSCTRGNSSELSRCSRHCIARATCPYPHD